MAEQLVQIRSSLSADGKHRKIVPADVRGRFNRWRRVVFLVLIGILIALPWIQIGGHPAVFLDLEVRHFYLFGAVFDATDVWLMTFLLTGLVFGLVVVTALLGRAWCGWACPQTVFVDGLYRRVERFFLGSREQRRKRDAGPWTAGRIWRNVATQASFIVLSVALANMVLSYFVSLPRLFDMMGQSPTKHASAFIVMALLAGLLYFDLAWFREQFCVVLCPYGRLQSVLLDKDSLVVGYDKQRGEPRGKAKDPSAGACVDCQRCVVVCPTGIDIRNGLQLDCIACTACIDACDEVMDKLGRPRGLVRYDSQQGLAGKKTRLMRGRLVLYAVLLVIGGGAAAMAFGHKSSLESTLTRLPGPPFTVDQGVVQNAYELAITNKQNKTVVVRIEGKAPRGAEFRGIDGEITLAPLEQLHRRVFVRVPRDKARVETVQLEVEDIAHSVETSPSAGFLAPGGGH